MGKSLNWHPKVLLVKSLAETLFWAKKCYYDGHYGVLNFGIADETFDKMETELSFLCPEHPILHCVGSPDFNFLLGLEATSKLVIPEEDLGDIL